MSGANSPSAFEDEFEANMKFGKLTQPDGNNMLARIQILPGGIIIGHVIPQNHPANKTGTELEECRVYEINAMGSGELRVGKIGIADFQMPDPRWGMDKFLVLACGNHLTVNGGK